MARHNPEFYRKPLIVQVDAVGVYVKAVNLSTGEIVETTLRMESDVDAATSAVNQMSISAE